MTARADDVLAEAARLGVSIRPGNAPGRVRMVGPSEAVQRLTPLVAQHKAELLEALTERQAAPEPPKPEPRLSWSDCAPATAAEIALMLKRTEAFERAGLSEREVDWAVDRLLRRDRDLDDRLLCIECAHIRTSGMGWRCGALRQSLPRELVATQPQRCDMFEGAEHD
jgi:hypothetical protein